jgi:hypothetical protein
MDSDRQLVDRVLVGDRVAAHGSRGQEVFMGKKVTSSGTGRALFAPRFLMEPADAPAHKRSALAGRNPIAAPVLAVSSGVIR